MKVNKFLWVSVLVLLVSVPLATAFTLSDILRNPWFMFAVNTLIIWIILFIIQAYFILPEKIARVKVVIWIVTVVLAGVIAFFLVGGRGYIWEAELFFTPYFKLWIIVNTIIIAAIGYFGLGFLGVSPPTKQGQIGMALLVILFAGIMAVEIGDKFIIHTDNAQALKEYLFGDEVKIGQANVKIAPNVYKTVDTTKGGILTYKAPAAPGAGGYRLLIFVISLVLFSWFFTGFLMPQGGKLSYVLAVIIAANLASKGTPMNTMITIGEVFAIIMVQKQIAGQGGIFGGVIGWIATIVLVEFIFCAVFGYSAIAIQLSQTLGGFTLPQIKVPFVGSFGGWAPFAALPKACDAFAAITGATPPPGVAIPVPPGTTGPGVTVPPPTTTPPPTTSDWRDIWLWKWLFR